MKLIFATTNERKIKDLYDIINKNNFDIEVLTLNDIGWNLGEIEETGKTIQENSLIKAKAAYDFCRNKNIDYTIIADDAGLFVSSLNGEPGILTARYADEERKNNTSLPKFEGVNKLLKKLENINDRSAEYRCAVTCMYPNGEYFQEEARTSGEIAKKIYEPIAKPYFYTVFIPQGYSKTFNNLNEEELYGTYRFNAIEQVLCKVNNNKIGKSKKYE
jgi:XTP/dITP diphosphohydrolase